MSAHRLLIVVLGLATAACTPKVDPSAPAPATNADGAPVVRASRNPDVISEQELQDPTIAGRNAMEAIRQLRPAFFRTRGSISLNNPTAGLTQISQDYGPLQPLNNLNNIDTRSLVQVRYLSAVDAQQRFGINANGGSVIVLLTTRP